MKLNKNCTGTLIMLGAVIAVAVGALIILLGMLWLRPWVD
jgi:hypothetical protein